MVEKLDSKNGHNETLFSVFSGIKLKLINKKKDFCILYFKVLLGYLTTVMKSKWKMVYIVWNVFL